MSPIVKSILDEFSWCFGVRNDLKYHLIHWYSVIYQGNHYYIESDTTYVAQWPATLILTIFIVLLILAVVVLLSFLTVVTLYPTLIEINILLILPVVAILFTLAVVALLITLTVVPR